MDEIVKNLSSPEWWFTAVFVGLLIGVVGGYLKPTIDRVLSRVSGWWRARVEAQHRAREEQLAELSRNPSAQILATLAELRFRSRTSQSLLLAALFLIMTLTFFEKGEESLERIVVNAFSTFLMFMSAFALWKSIQLKKLVDEAKKRENSPNIPMQRPGEDAGR